MVAPFAAATPDVFPGWYRGASSSLALRCVFADTPMYRTELMEIRLANLDSGILGEHYTEDSIVMEPGTEHFDLMDPEQVRKHVDAVVANRRAASPNSSKISSKNGSE